MAAARPDPLLANKTVPGILFGFTLVIVLMMVILNTCLEKMDAIRRASSVVTSEHDSKDALIFQIRDAAQQRVLLLRKFFLISDPIELDQARVDFQTLGSKANIALDRLETEPLSVTEHGFLDGFLANTKVAVPLLHDLIDLRMAGKSTKELQPMFKRAFDAQEAALADLSRLEHFQEKMHALANTAAAIEYDHAQKTLLWLGGSATLIALLTMIFIARWNHKSVSEIHDEREKFKALFEESLDAVVLLAGDIIEECNGAALRLFGAKDKSGLVGISLLDFGVESVGPSPCCEKLERCFEPDFLAQGKSLEWVFTGVHGRRFVAQISLTRIELTERSTLQAVMRDVTEMRRVQEAVKAERHRFLAILDLLPVHLMLVASDHSVIFANRLFRERYGESRGIRCYEMLGRNSLCEVCETFKVLDTGIPVSWESLGAEGRHYQVHGFPFIDTDGSPLILEVAIDVTNLKHAEASIRQLNATLEQRVIERTASLEAANRELESFSYSVSHDLQGPLRAINGFGAALREEYGQKLGAQGEVYLERIRNATLRMGELIDGLLMLARVFRTDLVLTEIDVSALAHELIRELREIAPDRYVDVSIQPGLTTIGDLTLVRLLLKNLLENSWKFTAKRNPAHIDVKKVFQRGREVFVVRDNGVGFEMEYATKLFQPFTRLYTQGEFDGTGIGLATVRRIVQRHGGEVWAEGRLNQGAALYFTLTNGPFPGENESVQLSA